MPASVSATEAIDECQMHAANLAAAMKKNHGGDWRVSIDPKYGFAMVVRDG